MKSLCSGYLGGSRNLGEKYLAIRSIKCIKARRVALAAHFEAIVEDGRPAEDVDGGEREAERARVIRIESSPPCSEGERVEAVEAGARATRDVSGNSGAGT